MGWTTGVGYPAGIRILLLVSMSRPTVESVQPAVQWVWLECEGDRSILRYTTYGVLLPRDIYAFKVHRHRDEFALSSI
jgi:hypothetical protein